MNTNLYNSLESQTQQKLPQPIATPLTVFEKINQLNQQLNDLGNSIENLNKKLEPILNNSSVSIHGSVEAGEANSTSCLGGLLNRLSLQVNHLNDQIYKLQVQVDL